MHCKSYFYHVTYYLGMYPLANTAPSLFGAHEESWGLATRDCRLLAVIRFCSRSLLNQYGFYAPPGGWVVVVRIGLQVRWVGRCTCGLFQFVFCAHSRRSAHPKIACTYVCSAFSFCPVPCTASRPVPLPREP
eukprot:scaffold70485_cov32-Tisochrysis_lutea.AAC.5